MKKRIMAIAAAVILVAAFVFMAVPAGAAIVVPNGFINDLSSSSLLLSATQNGSFSGDDFTGITLFTSEKMLGNTVSDGVILWFLVESVSNMPQLFDAHLLFSRVPTDGLVPPYPKCYLSLNSREFISLNGISYDLYSYTYSSSDWNSVIGGVSSPNRCSLYVTGTDGLAAVDTSWYFGVNTVTDFYGAFLNAGKVDQSAGGYQGVYTGADWVLTFDVLSSYGSDYVTELAPELVNGFVNLDAMIARGVSDYMNDTGRDFLVTVSGYSLEIRFYEPYSLEDAPIRTFGGENLSVVIKTANGNPTQLTPASLPDGWIGWYNDNVSQALDFAFMTITSSVTSNWVERLYVSNADFNAGYNAGYDDGYINGEVAGSESGFSAGYDEGYDDGDNAGWRRGTAEGYEYGLQDGYKDGFENGYLEGEIEGLYNGEQNGYKDGYREGLAVAEQGDFYSLFSAVIDAPVSAFTNLLDFQVLGVNVAEFVLSLISAFFAIKIVRIFV